MIQLNISKKERKKTNKIDIVQKEHNAATEPTNSNLYIIPENDEPIFEKTPLSEPQVSIEVLKQASVPIPEETLKNDESTLRKKPLIDNPIVKDLLKMYCPTLDISQAIDDKTLKEILIKENPALESHIETLAETQKNES